MLEIEPPALVIQLVLRLGAIEVDLAIGAIVLCWAALIVALVMMRRGR